MHIEINLCFQMVGKKIRNRFYTKKIDGDQMEMIQYMHSLREKHSCTGDDSNNFSIDIKGYRYVT